MKSDLESNKNCTLMEFSNLTIWYESLDLVTASSQANLLLSSRLSRRRVLAPSLVMYLPKSLCKGTASTIVLVDQKCCFYEGCYFLSPSLMVIMLSLLFCHVLTQIWTVEKYGSPPAPYSLSGVITLWHIMSRSCSNNNVLLISPSKTITRQSWFHVNNKLLKTIICL